MKITKIAREKEMMIIWTDEFPKIGFNFEIDSIINKTDLLEKVQSRVNKLNADKEIETNREIKFNQLTS